jgi:hypothetical protein
VKTLILACAIIFVSQGVLAGRAEDNIYLTQMCEGTAEDGISRQDQTTCNAYIWGLLDMNTAIKFVLKLQLFCPPDGFNLDQLRLVVVKSLKADPEHLNEAFGSLAISALAAAFPCVVQK